MLAAVIADGVLCFGIGDASFGGLALDVSAPPRVLVDEGLRSPGNLEAEAAFLDRNVQRIQPVRQARIERRLKIRSVAFQVPELSRLPAVLFLITGEVEGIDMPSTGRAVKCTNSAQAMLPVSRS